MLFISRMPGRFICVWHVRDFCNKYFLDNIYNFYDHNFPQYLAINAYLNLCCIEEFVFDLAFFIHIRIFNKSEVTRKPYAL